MLMKFSDLDRLMKDRRAILTINIVLGLLLLTAVLFFVRDTLSLAVSKKATVVKAEKKTQRIARRQLQDYAPLMRSNPFGFPAGELTLVSAASSSAVSQTDFSLIGTISGKKGSSYAIFSDKTGKQDIFKPGDNVFGLGTLKEVGTYNVIVKSGSREIDIPFSDITIMKEIKPSETTTSGFGKRTGASSYVIDQQRVQQALEKPDQLMTEARFVPNIVEGKQQGFVLREVKPGGIYQSLGLQNGDVLLRINEYAISSPDTALQAITALRGIDRVQLDVIRNGSKMTMTYQIR